MAKAMLAVWTLFMMTAEILTAMAERNNPWAYCNCKKCNKENSEMMRDITVDADNRKYDLKMVANNALLVVEMVQKKIINYDDSYDWYYDFMERHRGNSFRNKIKNMMRSLSFRAQRLPSIRSIRRSLSGKIFS